MGQKILDGRYVKEEGNSHLTWGLPIWFELPKVDPTGIFRKSDREQKPAEKPLDELVEVYEEKQKTTRMARFAYTGAGLSAKYGDFVDEDGELYMHTKEGNRSHPEDRGQKNTKNMTEQ